MSPVTKRSERASSAAVPRSGAARTATWRERMKAEGWASVTVIVPSHRAAEFQARAAEACAAQRDIARAALSALAAGPAGAPAKRAEQLARHIAQEVSRMGWPVGKRLGSEAELMQRHGASRSVLREAVRLLEAQSVARMRRGGGGGLVVTSPSAAAAVYAVSLCLQFQQVAPADLLETRLALELASLDRVLDRLDDTVCERVRTVLDFERALTAHEASAADLQRFHRELATLSGDPAIALFLDVLLGLMVVQAVGRDAHRRRAAFVRVVRSGHALIGEALLAGDWMAARGELERYLRGLAAWVH